MSGFYYFAGPLSCALCNRFGFRIVGVLGGLTSGLLFVYASYCYNLTMFLVVVGFCGGIAFNMVYTPTILVCGFYFERYRALATAISVTGTSIGIMAFPIIINNLFHHLEWRMEFRILAGSFGMIMLLVLIFKPIKPTRVVAKKGTSAVDLSSEDEDSIGSFDFGDVEEDKDVFTLRKIFQNFHNKFFPTMSSNKDSSTTIESKGSKKSAAPSTYFGW
ncbi:unnamed protein product [Acanthoscelides obtectus]|uniref:Major facilitator superfamily (MFS) profile domain-containing protein n=1 Tax=Acanthoscelides obtectus TaxID=200917 RepID=A0A9P0KD48_ACAOB|nr:unnamed protein product [Acanthoscelides obtectus]CAK1667524.1 Monocarboxylate transporter 6 [Acanthoscelides obtectus]